MWIPSLGSVGSFLDGGACSPFQEAAVPMLEPSLVKAEMIALQRHFKVGRMTSITFGPSLIVTTAGLIIGQEGLCHWQASPNGIRYKDRSNFNLLHMAKLVSV